MWVRLTLDIGWGELARGFFRALGPADRQAAQHELETFWSAGIDDALACLSVRSGFDLLLAALELPAGAEVLFSAVTLRDMPQIAVEHGLRPAPVDVCGSDFRIDVSALRRTITPQSRVLVTAHLFGARPDMREVLQIACEHDLFVVEDCAQAWRELRWRGNEPTDASLFSFGTIKTATALGGALCRVRDAAVLARMREIQAQQPVQDAARLPLIYGKTMLLKMLTTKFGVGSIYAAGKPFGKSIDDILGGLTRAFSREELLRQMRQRPCAQTLTMLLRRLQTYDAQRIERRMRNAQRIITNLRLKESQPELLDAGHSFWLFPYLTDHADELAHYLRRHGFDTARRGRMEVLPAPADRPDLTCPTAEDLLRRTLFLPCYSEMTKDAIDHMCELIAGFPTQRPGRNHHTAIAVGGNR